MVKLNTDTVPRIKLLNRIMLQLRGYVYVGDRERDGWKEPLPHYAFKCPEHGIVVDYPHGHDKRLQCPICIEILARERAREHDATIFSDTVQLEDISAYEVNI